MRKYERNACKDKASAENFYVAACQQLHHVANICHNWLNVTSTQSTQLIQTEGNSMRSVRLAVLKPVTHEVTADSLLQLVVLPASFEDPRHRGLESRQWQLLIYSWLTHEQTERLREHVFSKIALKECSVFRVSHAGCEKIFSNGRTMPSLSTCAR